MRSYINDMRVWTVGGVKYLVSVDTTIRGNAERGYTFSHPTLDLVPVNECVHCGRHDVERHLASGIDEAIERGYLRVAP